MLKFKLISDVTSSHLKVAGGTQPEQWILIHSTVWPDHTLSLQGFQLISHFYIRAKRFHPGHSQPWVHCSSCQHTVTALCVF